MLVVSGSSNIASGIRSAASAGDAYTGGAGEVASTTQLSVTLGSHDMAQANAVRVDVTGVTVFWAPVRAKPGIPRCDGTALVSPCCLHATGAVSHAAAAVPDTSVYSTGIDIKLGAWRSVGHANGGWR